MPRCVICHTNFFYGSRLDPPESCDCGAEMTREAAQEDEGRARALSAAWKQQDEDEESEEEEEEDSSKDPESNYNHVSYESTSSYRDSMRDAGRGHLLP